MAATTTKKNARLVKVGDGISVNNRKTPEIVRGVQIVVQLANGTTEVYDAADDVTILPLEDIAVTEEEVDTLLTEEADYLESEGLRNQLEDIKTRVKEAKNR